MALAKFEELKATAIEAANDEREALKAIWKLKKQIREQALSYGDNGLELGDIPTEMQNELDRLTTEAMAAKEVKLSASEEAQEARIAFNELFKARQEEEQEAEVIHAAAQVQGENKAAS